MRALVMTGPSQGSHRTEIREIAEPTPGPGEVTVDVAHAGINFLDVMARRGDPGYVAAWPYVPGKEIAGTVREVGPGVTDLFPGQRVAAFIPGGGLAEVALARAALTVSVPDGVPSEVAASAPLMLASALLLLTDAGRFRAGETVLVHSASGGVGSAVARLVPALGGGRLIGTVGRPGKVSAALSSGYDAAIARQEAGVRPETRGAAAPGARIVPFGDAGGGASSVDPAHRVDGDVTCADGDLAGAIRAAAGGGVDLVLDPLGTATLDLDLDVAAPGARIVLFGNAGGGAMAPLPSQARLRSGNIGVVGFSISSLSATAPHRVAAALRRVLDLIAEGRLDVPVTEVGSLAEVPAVHQLLAEGRGEGKYAARVGRPFS
ncbi:quinone oxidoreductase family protein [Microbispora sp. ATCC PTA-5024]|uniref:quinone oxidoreductase family protein n=1 Tax=Microbispora sp. ATCC PTA-5024 TaxID=316330 RepID=UPI0003DBFBCC|nr:zinc-binding dehydrogenase [Microbispora sp. ATCC PTA-5024]ETK30952.1 quinone oxidoreductase [Microbispora sp. ATCC PTA-5024]